MPIGLYQTATMLKAIKVMPPVRTFLRDRYFPSSDSDVFPTDEVLVEIKNGRKVMAPVVLPRKGGITVEREGYQTNRYKPPFIAPQRPLTIDDLNKKGFGENLFSNKTPEQRQAEVLANDLMEFETMISLREEFMAAQILLNNECILRQYADEYGSDNYEEYVIRFYEGTNQSVYTPETPWNDPDADIFGDLQTMIRFLTQRGLPATDLIMAPDVAEAILMNEKFQKLLDIQRINVGSVDPQELPAGAASLGKINVYGRSIELFTYDETYEDEITGEMTPYIPSGKVILTAPGCGRRLYGAISQIEEENGPIVTYAERRVPKQYSDTKTDTRMLRLGSRPLLIPNSVNPFISADVLG